MFENKNEPKTLINWKIVSCSLEIINNKQMKILCMKSTLSTEEDIIRMTLFNTHRPSQASLEMEVKVPTLPAQFIKGTGKSRQRIRV